MLIERYEIDLEVQSEQDPLWKSPARGALMHGVLMQQVESDRLHSGVSSLRPYTQQIASTDYRKYIWTINILEHSQAAPILEWLDNLPPELYISHYDTALKITDVRLVKSVSYSDFMQETLSGVAPKFAAIELLTPTAFKKAGQQHYHLWPEPRLIAQSALNRWNTFGAVAKFDDPSILDDIAAKVQINSFSLDTRQVSMDGTNFSGTVGRLAFYIQNAPAVREVFNLCGCYAVFCGIGMKTAMGLGAVLYDSGNVSIKPNTNRNTSRVKQLAGR